MTLVDECAKTLGVHTRILDNHEKKAVIKKFHKKAPLTEKDRINWDIIGEGTILKNEFELRKNCKDGNYYIVWDNPQFPVLRTNLDDITYGENIYSIMDVSFETWLISEDFTNIVEFYRNGEITYKELIEVNNNMSEIDKKQGGFSLFKAIFKIIKYLFILLIILSIILIILYELGFIDVEFLF